MDIPVDGKARPVVEVGRMFGVDIFNPDSLIGASLTLDDRMHGRVILFDQACTVTVPTGLRPDFSCGWSQESAGAITFAGADGVTIQSFNSSLVSGGQYAMGGIAALSSAASATATVFRLVGALA